MGSYQMVSLPLGNLQAPHGAQVAQQMPATHLSKVLVPSPLHNLKGGRRRSSSSDQEGSHLSKVLVPLPLGARRVVCTSLRVGMRTGPLTCRVQRAGEQELSCIYRRTAGTMWRHGMAAAGSQLPGRQVLPGLPKGAPELHPLAQVRTHPARTSPSMHLTQRAPHPAPAQPQPSPSGPAP